MRAAICEYQKFRAQGVSREDSIGGLDVVLRDVWPKQVSKFPAKCDACDDTGYNEHICRQYVRCGRTGCDRLGEAWQHTYVVQCHCDRGQAARRAEQSPSEHTIGKVSKPKKSWQRLGV
jgi:hypothetical protein